MDIKYEKKEIALTLSKEEKQAINIYSDEYIGFLNECKTEYLCVEKIVEMLQSAGFEDISSKEKLEYLDKVYFVNKQKSLFAAVIGQDKIVEGMNLVGAHIDSPRLDLKPMPLHENKNAALLKTQCYGGIKKYQWLSMPLAMHGVVYNEKGEKIKICIGESDNDPCFTITDLLPHLAKDQMKLNANEFIDPEKMSILFGSGKLEDKKESTVKDSVLKILNEKYGIKEIDFARSEISFVPAIKARYVGIDSSMIGGYGQDDRVCAFATIKALIDSTKLDVELNKTNVAIIVDKEEVGSMGNTGMYSQTFDMFVNKLLKLTNQADTDILEVFYNSKMLSADVSTCVEPMYEEVSDIQNSNILGCGVALEKYSGGSGKGGGNDANAEYLAEVMNLFEAKGVKFQVGTLGKQGKGGGGTIAYILGNKGIDVIDVGTPVLGMHSPFEVASKYDTYMTYFAYKAFFGKR